MKFNSHTDLNAITRTIDQSCKGVAPVVTGLIMTVTSLTTAAICIAVWNLVSVFVEYGILAQVYHLVPQLAVKEMDSDTGTVCNSIAVSCIQIYCSVSC